MSAKCCGPITEDQSKPICDGAFRRALWAALIINFSMFLLEIIAGVLAGSVSLQADALDFLADSANYVISLFVIGSALKYRAIASLIKGSSMGVIGLWVLGISLWNVFYGGVPDAITMGWVGALALISNAVVMVLLLAYRNGDSNMRSVWICSRNDVIGNFAVLLAALGVFGTGTAWPDIIVAAIMALLALQGTIIILRDALKELKSVSLQKEKSHD